MQDFEANRLASPKISEPHQQPLGLRLAERTVEHEALRPLLGKDLGRCRQPLKPTPVHGIGREPGFEPGHPPPGHRSDIGGGLPGKQIADLHGRRILRDIRGVDGLETERCGRLFDDARNRNRRQTEAAVEGHVGVQAIDRQMHLARQHLQHGVEQTLSIDGDGAPGIVQNRREILIRRESAGKRASGLWTGIFARLDLDTASDFRFGGFRSRDPLDEGIVHPVGEAPRLLESRRQRRRRGGRRRFGR